MANSNSVEVDQIDEQSWDDLAAGFADYNLYQTWPYEAVKSGDGSLSHLVLRENSRVVAAVQVRCIPIPYSGSAVAYARWGPLWRRRDHESDLQIFRQAVRALRAEYVDRRGFILRILPRVAGEANGAVRTILEQEGYTLRPSAGGSTILLDMRPSLDELYRGLHHKWRYHLNKARKQDLEVVDGDEERFFVDFERIYDEMLDRKRFTSFTDVTQLKDVQRRLPPAHKMRVFLLSVAGEVCAGGVCSDLGDTALYLFGATSNRGTKTYGSYLVHWRMLTWAKERGCRTYDINGVDPVRNAGGYQFKSQLAHTHGHQASFVGQFDAYPNLAFKALVSAGDPLRLTLRNGRRMLERVLAPVLP
jgi:hypothetical protein